MAKNFAEIAFTESVKRAQKTYGSRHIYQKVEKSLPDQNQLFLREMSHIQRLDGFYMATVGENGWPYVQFRGGPKGFLKVIDQQTLGYADYQGNMQYISTGNINATEKAALILLHYPTRTRLKIWATTEVLDPEQHPDIAEKLIDGDYNAQVGRLVIFHIEAYDWNCPQHIPQRFTLDEFQQLGQAHPEIQEAACPDKSIKNETNSN